MRSLILVAFTFLMLSGCQTLKIITTPTVDPSSGEEEWTAIIPVTSSVFSDRDANGNKTKSQWEALFGFSDDGGGWRTACTDAQPAGLAILPATVLTALGGTVWDLAVAAANSKVDEVQQKSTKTWSATWSGNAADWQKIKCVVLARIKGGKVADTQMSILLSKKSFDTGKTDVLAFQFSPILLSSKTSLAMTKDDGGGKGKVGISIAAAADSYKDGERKESSSDAVSIGGISVADPNSNASLTSKRVGIENYNYSKPTPFYSSGSVYLKFSVVETGALAGLDSKSKAEIKAVTDALGPIAKEALKSKLEKESAK